MKNNSAEYNADPRDSITRSKLKPINIERRNRTIIVTMLGLATKKLQQVMVFQIDN